MTRTTHTSGGTVVSGYLDPSTNPRIPHPDEVLVRPRTQDYEARMHSWSIGRLAACDIRDRGSVQVRPTTPLMERPDSYTVGLMLAGSGSLVQQRRQMSLTPGALVLYSRSRPFSLELSGPHHYLVMAISASDVGVDRDELDAAAVCDGLSETSAARMMTRVLAPLPSDTASLPPLVRLSLGDTLISLLQAAIKEKNHGIRPENDSLFDRILLWIETHISDDDVSPARIAAAHNISVSYLHKVFKPHGISVSEHILHRRLDRVRMDIMGGADGAATLAGIGRRWGLADPSRFSRVFRSHFGMSPREMRERALHATASPSAPALSA